MGPLWVSSFAARSPGGKGGPPTTIVCLHGIEGQGLRFIEIAGRLPEFTIVAPDLRGHGRSPMEGPWSIAQHVADVTAVLEGLSQPVVLLGHSYGGLIAWEVARAVPNLVSRLILVDPAIVVPAEAARWVFEDRITAKRWPDHASALNDLLTDRAPEAHWSVALDVAVATARDADGWLRWRVADGVIDACAQQLVVPLQPSDYRGPTLLLEAGREKGRFVTPAFVADLRRQLGDRLEHVVLDAVHTIPADNPDLLAASVREFAGGDAGRGLTLPAMKAAWRDRYGQPDVVQVRDLPKPVPTGKQVLVRVEMASVNRADLDGIVARWALLRLFSGLRRPRINSVGIDVAGVVEAVGEEATRFKVGDRVFGDLFPYGQGAFAEYVSAPEKAFELIPDAMSFEVAATLPHSAVLALQGLRLRKGRTVGQGDRVMVVGASGNVGPFAVQIAKSRGAHVTGVASGDKLDFVRSLGADEVIDYRTTDYTRPVEPYDWILDVDAHHPLRRWPRALKPRGVYVAQGGSGGWMLSLLFWQPMLKLTTDKTMGLMLHWKPFKPEDVDELKRLVTSGDVRPAIDRRFTLDQVADALSYVHTGQSRGKVLVVLSSTGAPSPPAHAS